MYARSTGRRLPLTTFALSVAAATAMCAGGSSIAAAKSKHHTKHHTKHHASSLAGKWSGSYSGAYSGTFTLEWKQSGSNLTGSITLSSPSGTYTCTGSVHGSSIMFGAVGAGATYTGSVSGGSMSGHYTTAKGGGSWSAHKTS
ncbi:MAG: hypothetical protein ACYDA6_08525 [Solirubrobacteraceae bacterium]